MRWQIGVLTVTFVFCGCGGAVEAGPEGAGGKGPTGGTEAGGATRLGTCSLGPSFGEAASCAWLANGHCYATREAACNCACPTDAAEVTCISDWPVDGQSTDVYCF